MAEMEGDDGFLSELLELLGDADEGTPSQEPPRNNDAGGSDAGRVAGAPTRGQSSFDQQRRAAGSKRELLALREEAGRLTDKLDRLRSACWGQTDAMERALIERRKRKRAESECRALRESVDAKRRFLRGFQLICTVNPRLAMHVDMGRFLHFHIRLSRDQCSRWTAFDAEAHDLKMCSALDMLCRETESISLEDGSGFTSSVHRTPYAHCEVVDRSGSHAVTFTSVYTVNTRDLGAVVRGTCVAIRDWMTSCPTGHSLSVSRDIVDATVSIAPNLFYRVMGVHHHNVHSGEEILLESHMMTSYKLTDDYAVVLWDFVDDDQLHPKPETTNITSEVTGACLIRREMCGGGIERTVVRSINTKRLRYHDPDAQRKHGCGTSDDSMYGNERLFRTIVQDQVATEEALLVQATAAVGLHLAR